MPAPVELGSANVGSLYIEGAWVAETIGPQRNSAAYLSIRNGSGGQERLMGVQTDVAQHISLHRTVTEDGLTRMESVDAMILQPGSVARLSPGGYHIMLMGLDGALVEGDMIGLTLEFLEAGDVSFEVPVMPRAAMMHNSNMHDGAH